MMLGDFMKITIRDIAQKANVSTTTVSRVLNNKPDVGKETVQKIKRLIEELGYQPSSIARGLVLKKTYTIGLIIPDVCNPYFPELLRNVEDEAKKYNYSTIFCNTDNIPENEIKVINLLRSKQVDGLIISSSSDSKGTLEQLTKMHEEHFPFVLIGMLGNDESYKKFSSVTIDNFESGYNATKYLIDLGHRKIAHITGLPDLNTCIGRREGYKQALKDSNIIFKQEWLVHAGYTGESGYSCTKQLLHLQDRPTAIFTANDLLALGCFQALSEEKIAITNEISLIGHDDVFTIYPKITTMRQPKREIAQKSVEFLLRQINKDESAFGASEVLHATCIVRKTTRKLNKD